MCNPFDEDASVDVRTRVAMRKVQWHYLRERKVSQQCEYTASAREPRVNPD